MTPLPAIVLASQSPRRSQMLQWAELQFTVIVPNTTEWVDPSLSVEEVPVDIALQKALEVQRQTQDTTQAAYAHAHRPILAADTIVVLDGQIIGKPANRSEAIETLSRLSGRQHRVITGVVILTNQQKLCFVDTTIVEFYHLSMEQIIHYVDTYKPYDKAGAYAIQEWIGVVGIKQISGDFYNVMGLPIARVLQALLAIQP